MQCIRKFMFIMVTDLPQHISTWSTFVLTARLSLKYKCYPILNWYETFSESIMGTGGGEWSAVYKL